MADHPLADLDEVFEVNCAVQMGETIVVASQKVNVTRSATSAMDRQTTERGNIVVDVNQTKVEATLYNATYVQWSKIISKRSHQM